MKTIS